MLREYSRTKSESLAQIRTIVAEIQLFSRGLFFYWRTLYILHLALKISCPLKSAPFWRNSDCRLNLLDRLIVVFGATGV